MSEPQIVAKVEWPLALPLVISGLRSASLQVVATATVAAYSGGGGLGRLLITGNATRNYSEMFAGAIIVALILMLSLSLIFDALILLIQRGTLPWFRKRAAA